MAGDSRVTWEGVGSDVYSSVKLYTTKSALYGITGENCTGSLLAIDWLREGAAKDFRPMPPEYEHDWDWKLIELSMEGIGIYNVNMERELTLEPFLAVGSGRKVAMYCMKYLGMTPAEAVHEACKVDHWSEVPVYTVSLANPVVRRWSPAKRKK